MATRCNIIVEYGTADDAASPTTRRPAVVTLYRHWDGYVACTGKHLADVLAEPAAEAGARLTGSEVVARLLNTRDERGRADYQLTDSVHGDVEYVYHLSHEAGVWQVVVYERAGNWQCDNHLEWSHRRCNAEGLAKWAAKEEQLMKARALGK